MVSIHSHLAAVLICAAALAPFRAEAGDEGEDLLERWLASQTNLVSWSAEFTQIRSFPTLTRPLETAGRVSFKAPNSFRWELGVPARTVAVIGSEEALIYYPKLKRAERYALSSDAKGPWKDAMTLLDAGFPRSREELERRFVIDDVSANDGVGSLSLRPRSLRARRLLPRLRMEFDLKTLALRASEFEFADGSIMKNVFRESEANPDLPEGLFQLSLPQGVAVTEPGAK